MAASEEPMTPAVPSNKPLTDQTRSKNRYTTIEVARLTISDLSHQANDLFGAVCPARDAGVPAGPADGRAPPPMQARLNELGQAVVRSESMPWNRSYCNHSGPSEDSIVPCRTSGTVV
jgi:hypothetical protein